MTNNIEVELRGPLTKEAYDRFHDFLQKEGKLLQERSRILIDYSTFLPDEGLKDRRRDIRLRVTNGRPEIIIKTGAWGGSDQREEISVFAEEGSFDRLVKAFHVMGYSKGMLCIRNSVIYEYRNIEFALVEVPGHSYYFEAEKMANDEDKEALVKEISAACKELNLEIFNDEDFFKYIEALNNEANEVFDFNTAEADYFKKRFNV